MSLAELASRGTLIGVIVVVFLLGAAPVFAIRCIARVYPKGHARRKELVGEMDHVKRLARTLELWRWLGEQFATAICDGVPARWATRKGAATAMVVNDLTVPRPNKHSYVNARGIAYFLHKTEVVLRGGKPHTIYFFAKTPKNAKGEPVELPLGREVKENPRNGFLTVVQR